MYVCMHVCIFVCICMCVCISMCLYMSVYTCQMGRQQALYSIDWHWSKWQPFLSTFQSFYTFCFSHRDKVHISCIPWILHLLKPQLESVLLFIPAFLRICDPVATPGGGAMVYMCHVDTTFCLVLGFVIWTNDIVFPIVGQNKLGHSPIKAFFSRSSFLKIYFCQ